MEQPLNPQSGKSSPEERRDLVEGLRTKMAEMKGNVEIAATQLGLPEEKHIDLMAIMYGGIVDTEVGPTPNDLKGSEQELRWRIARIREKADLTTAALGLPREKNYDVMKVFADLRIKDYIGQTEETP